MNFMLSLQPDFKEKQKYFHIAKFSKYCNVLVSCKIYRIYRILSSKYAIHFQTNSYEINKMKRLVNIFRKYVKKMLKLSKTSIRLILKFKNWEDLLAVSVS